MSGSGLGPTEAQNWGGRSTTAGLEGSTVPWTFCTASPRPSRNSAARPPSAGALERLPPRALSDLGITPEDVPHIAVSAPGWRPRALRSSRSSPRPATGVCRPPPWPPGSSARPSGSRSRPPRPTWPAGWRWSSSGGWAYRRIHGELATYSDRELMADLRLSRSDIDGIAVEGADAAQVEFVRAHPPTDATGNSRPVWAASSGRQLPAYRLGRWQFWVDQPPNRPEFTVG